MKTSTPTSSEMGRTTPTGLNRLRRGAGRLLGVLAGASLALMGAALPLPAQPTGTPRADRVSTSADSPASKPAFPEDWTGALRWRSIGPANMGGRITAIAVNPKDTSMWWAATASGGLLKTVNNGVTFEHQFDREATVSIGDVAVAPSDPNILWVGTGEHNPRNSVSWGDGVYKSTDGGKTWKNMGLRQGFQTGRIAIHPADPNVVYVGMMGRLWGPNEERGLFKTTDGGETWEKILYIDDKTGVIDVQMKPDYPDTLLVATYERQRDGFDTNEPAIRNGPGSGLWRTTDGGKTWERLGKGLPQGALGRMGLEYFRSDPNVVFLVVESDRTGSEPANAPYIGLRGVDAEIGAKITDVTKGGPAEAAGLKVDDVIIGVDETTVHSYAGFIAEIRKRVAGDTVTLEVSRDRKSVTAEVALTERPAPATPQRARDGTGRRTDDTGGAGPFSSGLGGQRGNMTEQQGPEGHEYGGVYKSIDGGDTWTRINSLNPRPMYFSQIRADPSDSNNLWVLGVSLARSKDGGVTFTDDGGRGTHADHHALWIDPRDGRRMILGNDGGIYVSYDRGENWDHLNHVAIGQFYHVAVDPRPNYMVYGGLQDNGSWGGPSRSRSGRGPINEDWISIGGGDGFVCQVDPEDPDQIYYESQGGAMGRFNFRTGERGSIRPAQARGTRYRWNWKTPFVLSAHNPRIFYAAANHVFRSLDRGRTMKRISDEFTRSQRGSGTALAESPLDPDVLYVGSDDGALLATRNGGFTWTKLVDFPLSDEERNAIARVEESESGGGGGAPAAEPAAPAPAEAAEPAAEGERADAAAQPPASGDAPTPGDRPARGGGAFAERMIERLKEMDANSDGKIAKDEVPEQMQQMFERGDVNSDGVIDAGELQGLPQRLAAGRERGGRGPGGRGTGGRGGPGRGGARADTPAPGPATGQILPPEPVEAAPQAAQAPTPAAAGDPLTGVWTARASGGNFPGGGLEFSLVLTLGADGRVTGAYESERGNGQIRDGKFDRERSSMTAGVETERSEMDLRATLAQGKMTGQIEMGGGRFELAFEAERTSTTPVSTASASEAAVVPGEALSVLLPGPRWVSSIEASRYRPGRVYVTFDGHRSNDDEPYVFISEDFGKSWRSIRANLPTAAGSTRVIREDIYREDVLYLGTEFGAYVSVDRGRSWTRFNNNLPTVAVHEFAQHPTSGEIIAATHGRSLWILDVTPLRQISEKTAGENVVLFAPRHAVYWRPEPRRGGDNRRFVGENDDSSASILYALSGRPRSVTLQITDLAGEVIRDLEAKSEPGLHRVDWDLRQTVAQQGPRPGAGPGGFGGGRGGFGGNRGRLVPSGTYLISLKVDGELYKKQLEVRTDPEFPDYQPWARAGGFGGQEDDEEAREEEHAIEPLDRDD